MLFLRKRDVFSFEFLFCGKWHGGGGAPKEMFLELLEHRCRALFYYAARLFIWEDIRGFLLLKRFPGPISSKAPNIFLGPDVEVLEALKGVFSKSFKEERQRFLKPPFYSLGQKRRSPRGPFRE